MDRRAFDMMDFYGGYNHTDNSMDVDMAEPCFNPDYCVETSAGNNGVLAMAFVDIQPLDSVYETEKALERGTLFPNIDKPFFGGGNK